MYYSLDYECLAYSVNWQHRSPFFDDARVRRALTLAINRQELLRVINLPDSIPIFDGPVTQRQLLRRRMPEALPYDPAQAQALLEAAGWRRPKPNELRVRSGKKFRFSYVTQSESEYMQIAVYIQEQFQRLGVHMDIQPLDWGSIKAGVDQGAFEAAFGPVGQHSWWFQKYFGKRSPFGYKNSAVTDLVDRIQVTANPNEKDEIYRALLELFRTDVPITFLFACVETTLVHRRIRGLSSPWRADPLLYMDDLSLEEGS